MAARPGARLALHLALFYLGWVKFLAGGTDVYLIDYAQRAAIIALAWGTLAQAFRPPWPKAPAAAWLWALAGSAAIILADSLTDGLPARQALDTALFPDVSFPPLDNRAWELFDLTAGLMLVALSEELVFRRLWADWWDARGGGETALYLGSALVFGLLHLPQGLADTAIACIWGLLLMYLYRRGGSLPLAVLVHYLADLWYFT